MTYLSHLARARRRRLHAFLASNDGLRYLASCIPGGVFNLMALARLSEDERLMCLAHAWNSLPRREHRTVNLDELCRTVGLRPSEVVGSVAETAYELGMDVSELLGAIQGIPAAVEDDVRRAQTGSWRARERALQWSEFRPNEHRAGDRRCGDDPGSDLEPIEQDTIESTRLLQPRLAREQRPEGRS